MFKGRPTSDARAMDVRLQADALRHHRLNGAGVRSSLPSEEDALRFLSQEEQECLQFFEETIDSLEESLDEDEQRPGQAKPPVSSSCPVSVMDGPPVTSSPNPGLIRSSLQARFPSSKDQDIIDLVCPEPDLVPTKEMTFCPTNPDFQSMVPPPESHFEIKPRRDPVDNLPSEYNPPLPSGSYGSTDSPHSYHPPGCIPTPVLIAQKIAENQAGGTSNLQPPTLLRRCSLESEMTPGVGEDLPTKLGPPTSAKPSRFPANISVILGSKEHQNQSMANVNIQERRAQMLANLSGTSHPLLQESNPESAEQMARNTPTRSISFRDPTPDKSRMEALSKLGLTRNRAMSGGNSLPSASSDPVPVQGAETSATPPEVSVPPPTETSAKLPEANVTTAPLSQISVDQKQETEQSDSLGGHEERTSQPSPPPLKNRAPVNPPPEVTSLEFNSFGGKSIVVHPTVSSKPATSPTSPEPKIPPPVLANPSEFNTYGGKSKVMTPASLAVPRSDLPDILSSHIDKSHTLPAKLEPVPIEPNNYGGKSLIINPQHHPVASNRPPDIPVKTPKPPAPAPAPKPPRHSYHGIPQRAAARAPSPDHKRRPSSMFRSQGITVKFSGRGATDDSRREALRKLGLLKDS